MAMIKCPECGQDISDKSATCVHCGFPIGEHKESEAATNAADGTVSDADVKKTKKPKKKLVAIISSIVVIAIVVIITIVCLGRKPNTYGLYIYMPWGASYDKILTKLEQEEAADLIDDSNDTTICYYTHNFDDCEDLTLKCYYDTDENGLYRIEVDLYSSDTDAQNYIASLYDKYVDEFTEEYGEYTKSADVGYSYIWTAKEETITLNYLSDNYLIVYFEKD